MRRVLRLVLAETYPGTLWAPPPRLPARPPGDVGDARYWTETLGAAVCVGDFSAFRSVPERSRFRGSGIAPR